MIAQEVLLTPQECKWIIEESKRVSNIQVFDYENDPKVKLHRRFLTQEEHLVTDEELTLFITGKYKNWEINRVYEFKIIKYTIGGYFQKHIDGGNTHPNRYRTIITQLSDGSEYTGGDLIIEGEIVGRGIGNTVIFRPNEEHELTEIIEGERYALVCWIYRHSFNQEKSTI